VTKLLTRDLRHKVTIQQPSPVKDGKGGWLDDHWSDVATVWAEVTSLDGRESVIEHVLEGTSIYRVRMRYRADLRADWQLKYGELTLNITAAPSDPDGKRKQLVIMTSTASALKPAA
jgi:SPP1 family predicted phage head-tail adaptor